MPSVESMSEVAVLPESVYQIAPRGPRLLIEREPVFEKTAGGIILPESEKAKQESMVGVILRVGQGRWSEENGTWFASDYREGQRILFHKYGTTEIPREFDNHEQRYCIVDENMVQAVIGDADNGRPSRGDFDQAVIGEV